MKQSPQEREQNKRFTASKFSAEGFLGADTRTPDEIIAEDRTVLEMTGVSAERIADALEKAYYSARESLGAPVQLPGGVIAVYHESMGKTPSPFRGEGLFEKGEVEVNGPDMLTLFISALGISLIRNHTFFQGRGSRYRIEPLAAIALFGLKP